MTILLGAEVLLRERLPLLKGARVGAVVHPASVLSDLSHTADVLFGHASVNLVALFRALDNSEFVVNNLD